MVGQTKLHSTRRRLGIAAMSAGLVAAAVTAPAASAAAAPCKVSSVGTGAQYGGVTAVAKAIATAHAGDTLEISGTCAANVTVTKDITLLGKGKRATLDGKANGRVLEITGATATLRDLIVRGGKTDASGGGIHVTADSAATLIAVEVSANTAGENSFGGGIHAGPRAHLLLAASSVEGNTAGSSGGIDSDGAIVSLHNSKVSDNHATHAPSPTGDSCAFGTPATIYACAGGIWNFLGTLVLIDSTVTHNTAGYRGGGLRTDAFVADTTGTLLNGTTILGGTTTIDTNSASDQGGGIWTRVRQFDSRTPVNPSVAFLVSNGSPTITDPLTGAPVPAWTGALTDNTPDQCFGLGFPTFSLGTHTCGPTFN
jgi:hypothetical protein